MNESKEIRCAVVGYGGAFNMGKVHAQWINASPGMRTIAACDLDESRVAAAKTDFPEICTYTDLNKCLENPEVDLVVIITPHNTHAKLALSALQAGKHVVLEKPMCLTVSEAGEMIEAAEKSGVALTTFHNRRHDGDFMAIKEAIEIGVVGDVFHIEAYMGGYNHPGKWWRSNKDISGGAFYDWGAHIVDWVLHFIPEKMESIYGAYHKRVWDDVTNEDQTQAVIRFAGGKFADIQISSISRAPKPRWRILGTKGGIIDDAKGSFKVFTEVKGYPAEMNINYKKSTWEEWYPNLSKHLLKGEPLEVTPESSRRVIAVIETAEKSAKSGKSEPVPYE